MSQHPEYLGIPFQCSFCRRTGHLWRDYKGFVKEEDSKDSMLWKVTCEHSLEVDSFEIRAHHSAREETSLTKPTYTFSGKLKTIFSSLFSTLTSWECDTLDSSSNQGKFLLKASPSFSLPIKVDLLSGGVKPTLLGARGFT